MNDGSSQSDGNGTRHRHSSKLCAAIAKIGGVLGRAWRASRTATILTGVGIALIFGAFVLLRVPDPVRGTLRLVPGAKISLTVIADKQLLELSLIPPGGFPGQEPWLCAAGWSTSIDTESATCTPFSEGLIVGWRAQYDGDEIATRVLEDRRSLYSCGSIGLDGLNWNLVEPGKRYTADITLYRVPIRLEGSTVEIKWGTPIKAYKGDIVRSQILFEIGFLALLLAVIGWGGCIVTRLRRHR